MSVQVATRFPDTVSEAMSQAVATGAYRSRAEMIVASVQRELRRQRQVADVAALRRATASDLDDLAEWTARNASELRLDA